MPSTDQDVRAELEREEQLDLADPLRHFLAISSPSSSPSASLSDIRDLPSSNDYSVVPHQLESIIDKRATIRYYKDITRPPQLLQSSQTEENEETEAWDVHLKLDMTTGCGGKIWPAAEVLGAYIAAKYSSPQNSGIEADEANIGYNNNNFDWRNKTIIELGSGTGLVGFLVHALNLARCRIYVTDQDVMLPLMRENLHLNFPSSTDKDAFVKVQELNWGTPLPPICAHPDVLLLADCVYLESAFAPLIQTMADLSTPDTEILFCYQKRRKADKRFFAMLKKQFTFQDVADDDEVRTKEYRRQGTQLLRIKKK